MRLSALGIEALAFSGKQQTHFDPSLPGFGVRVGKNAKTFVLMIGRERRLVSIGRYPAISLKSARTEAMRLLADYQPKKHPPVKLRTSEAIERFLTEKEAQTRRDTQRQYARYLSIRLKHIHGKYITDVTTDDITRVTDSLLRQGKGPSANHLLVAAKTFFKWCVRRRFITHSPVEGLERPATETARERVLSDEELRSVWHASPTVIRLLILLGQRRLETAKIRVDWLRDGTLTIPGAHTKNKRTHSLPVPEIALPLLAEVAASKPSSYAWSRTKTEIDRQSGVTNWRFHDLRRSYAVNLQRLGVRTEIIECLLNHRSGYKSGVTGIYHRYDFWPEMVEAVRLHEQWFQRTITITKS